MLSPFSYRLDAVVSLARLTSTTDKLARLHAAIEREITASSRRSDKAKVNTEEEYPNELLTMTAITLKNCAGWHLWRRRLIARFRSR
jgi:hypothetical protein